MAAAKNITAQAFKALHVPGKPIVLANVWDAPSARTVAALPSCRALATASFAIAQARGTTDPAMSMETNLAAVRDIAPIAKEFNKPLTVDFQEGYGAQLEEGIKALIDLGVVGANIEDSNRDGSIMPLDEAVGRIKRAVGAAKAAGVPDFVVNARADSYLRGGTLDESIARGKAYLDAGAVAVYVLGGATPQGPSREQIGRMVSEFQGRLNISVRLAPGMYTVRELADMGISRISVGPQLLSVAMKAVKGAAEDLMKL